MVPQALGATLHAVALLLKISTDWDWFLTLIDSDFSLRLRILYSEHGQNGQVPLFGKICRDLLQFVKLFRDLSLF